VIRLIIEAQPYPHRGQYIVRLEGDHPTGPELIRSRTPLYDGARELLTRRYPADALMTVRHAGSAIDSWIPTAIGDLAKWTIKEPNQGRIQRVKWQPYPSSQDAPPAYPVAAHIDVEVEGVSEPTPDAQEALLEAHQGGDR
jgi:hypothetical protein